MPSACVPCGELAKKPFGVMVSHSPLRAVIMLARSSPDLRPHIRSVASPPPDSARAPSRETATA